jgi:hypothetical protein
MNYNTLSNKKLQALRASESNPENVAAIDAVLEKRGVKPEQPEAKASVEPQTEETPEQREARIKALAEECRKNINKKCQAVPYNSADWIDGVIAGVQTDLKAGRVVYAIQLVDGRRIAKVHSSPLVKISEEIDESFAKRPRGGSRSAGPKEPVTDEQKEAMRLQYQENVGRTYKTSDETGKLIGLQFNPKTQNWMYVTERELTNDMGDVTKVKGFKSCRLQGLELSEERDEEIYNKYINRPRGGFERKPMTVEQLEKMVATKEAELTKLRERLEAARVNPEVTETNNGNDLM